MPNENVTYVVVANHASFLDHALLSYIPLHKKYLTKSIYFTLPFFGWTQWIVKDIGVDVSSKASRDKSIEDCKTVLKKGASIVIYPEGTRVKNPPTLGPFKEGAFRIARDAKVQILPVCLHNTHRALGHGFKPGRANLVMSIGEPFYVDDVESAITKVRTWMENDLGVVDGGLPEKKVQ
jgi:1-acyl-sn-glycerol-3-phosphate acyltransferase